jgi:hypothetical protein
MFLGLGTQRGKRVLHIVICGLSGSIAFFTLSHKRYNFLFKKVTAYYVFWISLQILSQAFLTLRRT